MQRWEILSLVRRRHPLNSPRGLGNVLASENGESPLMMARSIPHRGIPRRGGYSAELAGGNCHPKCLHFQFNASQALQTLGDVVQAESR